MTALAAIVFGTFSIFIAHPFLALLPAAGFAALYAASGRRLVAGAAVMWCLYTLYEYAMHRRWMCTGECNIRVDLLLMYPLLWIVSLAALIVGIIALGRRDPKAGV
jgi:hypothetical protein